jgi:hypothetical protein
MVLLHACLGLFLGAFLAIDLALMSLVLPDRDAEGRDMAILQVATSSRPGALARGRSDRDRHGGLPVPLPARRRDRLGVK